jgi:hypothetical protein
MTAVSLDLSQIKPELTKAIEQPVSGQEGFDDFAAATQMGSQDASMSVQAKETDGVSSATDNQQMGDMVLSSFQSGSDTVGSVDLQQMDAYYAQMDAASADFSQLSAEFDQSQANAGADSDLLDLLGGMHSDLKTQMQGMMDKMDLFKKDPTPAGLLDAQLEIGLFSVRLEVASKVSSKLSQNADTFLRAQ